MRVSQLGGTLSGTLYPGVHWTVPLTERVELFNTRDQVYSTSLSGGNQEKARDLARANEGRAGRRLAVTVRYPLDARSCLTSTAIFRNRWRRNWCRPTVASAFREAAPNYTVREVFAGRRDQMVRTVAGQITQKLAADGIVVKEVMLRDIQLPGEYAKGLEGLLLKEQENERMSVELELKQKMVKEAELEAEAQKARDVKAAEARAEVTVLEAKAQADAMQHTLPLKEKQIQQSRLEAEARKESTLLNAEAMAEAKIIDSKAELEKRKLTSGGRGRSHPARGRGGFRTAAARSRRAEAESASDSENHRREAFRQSPDHDGSERWQILFRERCVEEACRDDCGRDYSVTARGLVASADIRESGTCRRGSLGNSAAFAFPLACAAKVESAVVKCASPQLGHRLVSIANQLFELRSAVVTDVFKDWH